MDIDDQINLILLRRMAISGEWRVDDTLPVVYAPEVVAQTERGKRRIAKCLLDIGSEGITDAVCNARFIANAPADIDLLLGEIKRLRQENVDLEEALRGFHSQMTAI